MDIDRRGAKMDAIILDGNLFAIPVFNPQNALGKDMLNRSVLRPTDSKLSFLFAE